MFFPIPSSYIISHHLFQPIRSSASPSPTLPHFDEANSTGLDSSSAIPNSNNKPPSTLHPPSIASFSSSSSSPCPISSPDLPCTSASAISIKANPSVNNLVNTNRNLYFGRPTNFPTSIQPGTTPLSFAPPPSAACIALPIPGLIWLPEITLPADLPPWCPLPSPAPSPSPLPSPSTVSSSSAFSLPGILPNHLAPCQTETSVRSMQRSACSICTGSHVCALPLGDYSGGPIHNFDSDASNNAGAPLDWPINCGPLLISSPFSSTTTTITSSTYSSSSGSSLSGGSKFILPPPLCVRAPSRLTQIGAGSPAISISSSSFPITTLNGLSLVSLASSLTSTSMLSTAPSALNSVPGTSLNRPLSGLTEEEISRRRLCCYRFVHILACVELLFVFPDETAALACLNVCKLAGGIESSWNNLFHLVKERAIQANSIGSLNLPS
ncbi:unnamed protein product [Protopolystoma xenopodis]|uniref:Uncharacterized protein n=1 Tax=Protopolystoma xenopodis TaxID=117903 RepID=A0A3S5AJF8_9PLAT|nr:unnamed protein product [Protopolystoma xenopodis]